MDQFMLMHLKIYEKIINDYFSGKVKYMNIRDKLNKVNKGMKIYEKNQELYKNKPNIITKRNLQKD